MCGAMARDMIWGPGTSKRPQPNFSPSLPLDLLYTKANPRLNSPVRSPLIIGVMRPSAHI